MNWLKGNGGKVEIRMMDGWGELLESWFYAEGVGGEEKEKKV